MKLTIVDLCHNSLVLFCRGSAQKGLSGSNVKRKEDHPIYYLKQVGPLSQPIPREFYGKMFMAKRYG